MSRRNLILVLLAGFVLALGASGAARRDADRRDPATASTPAVSPRAAPGGVEANVVEGDLPADRVVRARVGDDVVVRIASATPDIARMVDLGLHTAVGPGLRGELRFRALSPGRFPVRLEVAGVSAGRIVVERAPQAEGAAP